MSAQIQTSRLSVEHQPQRRTVRPLIWTICAEKTSVMDKKNLKFRKPSVSEAGRWGVHLYVELVRYFFAVFRYWKGRPYFSIGIELQYCTSLMLNSCQISEEEKIRITEREFLQWCRITSTSERDTRRNENMQCTSNRTVPVKSPCQAQ